MQDNQQQIYLNPLQEPYGKEVKEQRKAGMELCTAAAACKSLRRRFFNNSLSHKSPFLSVLGLEDREAMQPRDERTDLEIFQCSAQALSY